MLEGERPTRITVAIGNVADTPRDLRCSAGLPVGAHDGHLVARQGLGDAIGTAALVVVLDHCPTGLFSPQLVQTAELGRIPLLVVQVHCHATANRSVGDMPSLQRDRWRHHGVTRRASDLTSKRHERGVHQLVAADAETRFVDGIHMSDLAGRKPAILDHQVRRR